MVEELAEEQKRLIEFGKWEVGMRGSDDGKEEVDAAMREGKPIPSGKIKDIEENVTVKEDNNEMKEDSKEIKEEKQEKEIKKSKTPSCPVNAEGKPISVDQHWKQFVSKKPTKKGTMKRSSAEKNKRETETANQESVVKKAKTLFDDEPEVESRKKIPLRPKK